MRQLGQHRVLEDVTQNSMVPPGRDSSLNEQEARRILIEWNRTAQAYDRTETVWGLIEKHARAHPERTAIVDGETEINYERLTARAGAIAGALLTRGVEPGSLVGVCMSRTWELVATLVGVLRAGCAYVPMDPEYPRERVRYMLEHARVAAACGWREGGSALRRGTRTHTARCGEGRGAGRSGRAVGGGPRLCHLHIGLNRAAEGGRRRASKRRSADPVDAQVTG